MAGFSLSQQRAEQSSVVLGNVNEVVLHVVRNIAGKDMAETVNGSKLTTDVIRTLAQARIKQRLNDLR